MVSLAMAPFPLDHCIVSGGFSLEIAGQICKAVGRVRQCLQPQNNETSPLVSSLWGQTPALGQMRSLQFCKIESQVPGQLPSPAHPSLSFSSKLCNGMVQAPRPEVLFLSPKVLSLIKVI